MINWIHSQWKRSFVLLGHEQKMMRREMNLEMHSIDCELQAKHWLTKKETLVTTMTTTTVGWMRSTANNDPRRRKRFLCNCFASMFFSALRLALFIFSCSFHFSFKCFLTVEALKMAKQPKPESKSEKTKCPKSHLTTHQSAEQYFVTRAASVIILTKFSWLVCRFQLNFFFTWCEFQSRRTRSQHHSKSRRNGYSKKTCVRACKRDNDKLWHIHMRATRIIFKLPKNDRVPPMNFSTTFRPKHFFISLLLFVLILVADISIEI